jgi:hypothetical protein
MSTTITETKPVITETKPVIIETKKKVVSLILTHQARIRCLLDMIIKGKRSEKKEGFIGKIIKNRKLNNSIIAVKNTINRTFNKNPVQYEYQEKEEEIRFKNCSILRLCVNKETGLCLQLVYGGELDPSEGKGGRIYYIANESERTPESIVTEVVFDNINAGLNRLDLTGKDFAKGIDEYVFYIGRHGQAEHNLKYATHLKTDTDVTVLGQQQAISAGKNLMKILKDVFKEDINYVFASDLIRTRQTIQNILYGMNTYQNKKQQNFFPKEIIILPCSHELKYNSKGICDKPPSFLSLKIGTKENDPKCSKTTNCVDNNIDNPKSDCNHITLKMFGDKEIPLNWDFYFEKNGNKMRNMDCSKTNMIKLAIEYINTTGQSVNKKKVVISNTNPVPNPPPKIPIISDDCLAECLKDFFNTEIDNNIDINQIKTFPLFLYLKNYFNDVYNMNDLNKKSYIDFFEFVRKNNNGSNSSNPINQDERDLFDNVLIKCLKDNCINKKPARPPPPPGPPGPPGPPPPPGPPGPPPGPPPPDGYKNDLNVNIEQQENNRKQIQFWVKLFEQVKTRNSFFKDFNTLTGNKNVFYKVMDELLSIDPINLNEIFNHYENKIETFNVIMSYLIDRLGRSSDENVLKFMDYIKNNNDGLYNKIIKNSSKEIVEKINKKRGGKKTRKNRKAKKRFIKRTVRSYKRSKTCRRNRKII